MSPPGWQVRHQLVMRWLGVISEMVVPQRGQGSPPLRWTLKKSLTLMWMFGGISRRTTSVASRSTLGIAS